MLIRTFVLDRINCRWMVEWLTAGARAALPHVSIATLAFTCGASGPPPPTYGQPPPVPPTAWQPPPPAWVMPPPWGQDITPAPDTWPPVVFPIPLGPVLTPPEGGPQETFGAPPFVVAELPPICAPETVRAVAPVDEPGTLALIGVGLLGLGVVRRKPCT